MLYATGSISKLTILTLREIKKSFSKAVPTSTTPRQGREASGRFVTSLIFGPTILTGKAKPTLFFRAGQTGSRVNRVSEVALEQFVTVQISELLKLPTKNMMKKKTIKTFKNKLFVLSR